MEENKTQEDQMKQIGETARKVLEIIEQEKKNKNKDDGEER